MNNSILMQGLDFIANEVPRIAELATQEERAAVVAWLRDCALDPETTGAEMRLFQNLATTIERGEHRREGGE
jgi:hypothetical protein